MGVGAFSDWSRFDFLDNCPGVSNPDQADADGDGRGDACDVCPTDPTNADTDSDGVCNVTDNCVFVANPGQEDAGERPYGVALPPGAEQRDGVGDACDNCIAKYNPEQTNHWSRPGTPDEHLGDACRDSDGDGRTDAEEDIDGDGKYEPFLFGAPTGETHPHQVGDRASAPRLTLTSPASSNAGGATSVTVAGSVTDDETAPGAIRVFARVRDNAEVVAHGDELVVDAQGRFSGDFPLEHGTTSLHIYAYDEIGNEAKETLYQISDQFGPKVLVLSELVAYRDSLNLTLALSESGRVTSNCGLDLPTGLLSSRDFINVTMNGLATPGDYTCVLTATDAFGNVLDTTFTVTRKSGRVRLERTSPDVVPGTPGGAVPVVSVRARLVDPLGQDIGPAAGAAVTFTSGVTSFDVVADALGNASTEGLTFDTPTVAEVRALFEDEEVSFLWTGVQDYEPQTPGQQATGPQDAAILYGLMGGEQGGTVGRELPRPLVVQVADRHGFPVQGAVVQFRATARDEAGNLAGTLHSDTAQGAVLTVNTNEFGLASVRARLGTSTSVGGYTERRRRASDPEPFRVGHHTFEARVMRDNAGTLEPNVFLSPARFDGYAFPDEPVALIRTTDDGSQTTNTSSHFGMPRLVLPITTMVTDRYGNPVANSLVVYRAEEASSSAPLARWLASGCGDEQPWTPVQESPSSGGRTVGYVPATFIDVSAPRKGGQRDPYRTALGLLEFDESDAVTIRTDSLGLASAPFVHGSGLELVYRATARLVERPSDVLTIDMPIAHIDTEQEVSPSLAATKFAPFGPRCLARPALVHGIGDQSIARGRAALAGQPFPVDSSIGEVSVRAWVLHEEPQYGADGELVLMDLLPETAPDGAEEEAIIGNRTVAPVHYAAELPYMFAAHGSAPRSVRSKKGLVHPGTRANRLPAPSSPARMATLVQAFTPEPARIT